MAYVVKIKSATGWYYSLSEPFDTEQQAKKEANRICSTTHHFCEVLRSSQVKKLESNAKFLKFTGVDGRKLIFTTFAHANRFIFPDEPVTLLAHVFNEKNRRSFRGVKFERTNELPTSDIELSKFNLEGYTAKNKLIATTIDGTRVKHYKNIATAMNKTTYTYRQIVDSIENGTYIDDYLLFKEI